jgi:uncharacterized protein YkwD
LLPPNIRPDLDVKHPRLFLALVAPCVLVACSDSSTTPTGPSDQPDIAVAQALESAVNSYRAQQGLPSLPDNSLISAEALSHSQDMAAGTTPVGHVGFAQREAAICSALPCGYVSENVAAASCQAQPAQAMVQGFLDSPEHRDAIVGAWDMTGVGVASRVEGGCRVYYATQLFYTRTSSGSRAAP